MAGLAAQTVTECVHSGVILLERIDTRRAPGRYSKSHIRKRSKHQNMKKRSCAGICAITAVCLSLGYAASAYTQKTDTHSSAPNTAQKGEATVKHATGPFDVKLNPQTDDKDGDPSLCRMSIDKQYHGD